MPFILGLPVSGPGWQQATRSPTLPSSAVMPIPLGRRSMSRSTLSSTTTSSTIPVSSWKSLKRLAPMPSWYKILHSSLITHHSLSMPPPRPTTALPKKWRGCALWDSVAWCWPGNSRSMKSARFTVRCPMSSSKSSCMVRSASVIADNAMPRNIASAVVPTAALVPSSAACPSTWLTATAR